MIKDPLAGGGDVRLGPPGVCLGRNGGDCGECAHAGRGDDGDGGDGGGGRARADGPGRL